MQLFDALKYGTIGLCAVLMFLAFQLLTKEQQAEKPRSEMITMIRLFMFLAVGSMAIGLISQLPIFRSAATSSEQFSQWTSGFGEDFFTGTWELTDAHDVSTPQFVFKPRYRYSGVLKGHVEGSDFWLSGQVTTLDIANPKRELGEAAFSCRGPVNNNEVAGHFTLTRKDMSGFGTAFMKFDGAGSATIYMIVRVVHVDEGEGDVAMVEMHLHRLPS